MNQNIHNLNRMLGGSRQIAPAYLPWYLPPGATSDGNDVLLDPWRSLEERLLLSLASSQRRPTPLQLLVLDDEFARELNPRRRDPFPGPAFTGAWYQQQQQQQQFPGPAFAGGWYQEPSRLTQEEQKAALKKLKKDVYNPMPKIITRRLSMFYQDGGRHNPNDKRSEEKHEEEERKRCAVCLEDFESREQVLITPCKHMFHEDCIVPWVKTHAQCPVCRFALCDRLNPH